LTTAMASSAVACKLNLSASMPSPCIHACT
jgi:hypothetical protein